MYKLSMILVLLISASLAFGAFSNINANLGFAATHNKIVWGDYDRDGKLDIFLLYQVTPQNYRVSLKVYHNDGNDVFSDCGLQLPAVSDFAIGDLNNDGYLDFVISTDEEPYQLCLYTYDGAGFAQDTAFPAITPYMDSRLSCVDYDNDGETDILMSGLEGVVIYASEAGTYSAITVVETDFYIMEPCVTAWADFDADGDLDLLVDNNDAMGPTTKIYYNQNGALVSAYTFPLQMMGLVQAIDYNLDGWADIIETGDLGYNFYNLKFHENMGDNLFGMGTENLTEIAWGNTLLGDYDNDGDYDLVITGNDFNYTMTGFTLRINEEAGFYNPDYTCGLPMSFIGADGAWGDYNNDGKLDIACAGIWPQTDPTTVYRNDYDVQTNTPPSVPQNLTSTEEGDYTVFSWDAAVDDQTPQAGLTYALRIGTTHNGNEVLASLADSTGHRQVATQGNIMSNCSWRFKTAVLDSLPHYYWSVQAIDSGFMGSAFAPEIETINFVGNEDDASSNFVKPEICVYPSPVQAGSKTTIKIGLPQGERGEVGIFNIKGHKVMSFPQMKTKSEVVWDTQKQPAGVYLVQMSCGSKTICRKVTVLK